MVEITQSADAIAVRSSTHCGFVFGILLVGHVAFAAACTPNGVRSGQWSLPGLLDPDFMVLVASGATFVLPLILYSMWAGLGPGDFCRRFAITAVVCVILKSAVLSRGWWRGSREPPLIPIVSTLLLFSLLAAGFWLIRRFSGWRIGVPGERPAGFGVSAFRPPQFSLRLLLALITFAACFTAFCRFNFPHGLPTEFTAGWWKSLERMVRTSPFVILMVLIVLPTMMIPWLTLASGGRSKLAILGAGIGWVAMDYGLIWLTSFLGLRRYYPSAGELVIAMQLGASAAALISALVFRFSGYRILKPS